MTNLELSEPLSALVVLEDESRLGGDDLRLGELLLGLLVDGVLSDLSVNVLVESSEVLDLGSGESLLPAGELLVEELLVLLLELFIVLLDVLTEDVLSMFVSVERGGLVVITFLLASLALGGNLNGNTVSGESLLVVRDVETTITSTLQGTEHSVSGGGADKTDIEVGLERTSVFLDVVQNTEELSVDIGGTLVQVSHFLLGEETAGGEETGGVGSGVVGKTSLETESLKLERISGNHGVITSDGGVHNLGDDSSVGSADDKSVLSGVVLVLVVDDESLSGEVVGLSLSSPSEFGLVSAGVSLVLEDLNETHSV